MRKRESGCKREKDKEFVRKKEISLVLALNERERERYHHHPLA